MLIVEVLCILTMAAGFESADHQSQQESVRPTIAETSDPEDTSVTRKMLGVWEDDYQGHRILTLKSDGTGVMEVHLKGLAATLFAATLIFEEEWSVEDGTVTMIATGGEPAGKVALVLRLHGNRSTQRIVEVTDEKMILVEEPSGTRFEWRRLADLPE